MMKARQGAIKLSGKGRGLTRRRFCQMAPLAVGLLSCPYLQGNAGSGDSGDPTRAVPAPILAGEEAAMPGKIKHIEAKVISVKGTCGLGA